MDVSTSCGCHPAHVLIFDHKSLFSLDFTSKMDVSTSRVVAIFGHKSCFHWILPVKMDVSTSRVVAILCVYLSSITSLCFHWILPVK